MSYADVDVLGSVESSSIAGGAQYDGKLHPSNADIEVSTVDGFLNALNGSSDVIAIANDAVLDLTGENQIDLGSKTLVSYRGWDGQEGALISTDSRGYYGRRPYTLFDSGGSPRVSGLRIRGARATGGFTRWDYADNLAQAIRLRGSGGEVDNCELFGWTWNAIHLKGDGESTVTDAEVHHNHIHKSYQLGYGYGINIRRGVGEIHHNYFDEARHAIAGYGWWNSGFVVENNVFGPRQYSHTVDMHCLEENQATARVGDDPDHPDYDLRAGGTMEVRNNTFCMDGALHGGGINAVAIRGVPWDGVWIENNRFAHSQRPPYNSGNNQEGFAWRQVNLNLSGWDPIPQDDEGYTLNWNDSDNQFGAPETPWESGYGAPIDLTDGSGGEEDEETEDEQDQEDEEQEDEQDVITISGGGSTTYYEFEFSGDGDVEKSEQYGATINDYDQISGSTVTGRTTNEPDSFAYTGEIVRFEADDGVEVLINGEEVDPATLGEDEETEEEDQEDEEQEDEQDVITISSDGSTTYYEFEFSGDGDIEKSEQYGATINDYDQISGTTVTGRTTNEPDSFAYTGEITSFSADGPVEVLINGEEVDPATLGADEEEEEDEEDEQQDERDVITISGGGSTTYYEFEFSVDGDIEKSEQYGATINDYDQISGSTVTGRTTNEPDSFAYTGEIVQFEADDGVEVLINGEEVDPATLGANEEEEEDEEDEQQDEQGVLTINGQGETVYYTFSVDGDVETSTANNATINTSDTIIGYNDFDTIVTGRTTNQSDSFVLDGDITSFSTSSTGGPAEISIDDESIDPDQFGETLITIGAQGSTARYELEFSVNAELEKSEQYGATINDYDQISGTTVTGRTTNEPDSFIFSGALTEFSADEPVDVSFNGEPTGIWI